MKCSPHWLITCLVLAAASAMAQDVAEKDQEKQARDREVMEHMQSITFERVNGANRDTVPIIDHALLTYTDPVRANDHGTVWAWGREGRPLAIVEVFQPSAKAQWIHAITLTSTDLVVASISKKLTWAPQTTQMEFKTIDKAPRPAQRESLRLSQLKELARKFEACEYWDPDNSRYELRLLVQPIHRYHDAGNKIIDGAVFLLAHGTNPEVAVLIEAQGESADKSEWRYGLARLGSAELHVSIDGTEVWKQDRTPGVVGRSIDPYWLFFEDPKPSAN